MTTVVNSVSIPVVFIRWALYLIAVGICACIGLMVGLLVQAEGVHTQVIHVSQQVQAVRLDMDRIEVNLDARIRRLEDIHLSGQPPEGSGR